MCVDLLNSLVKFSVSCGHGMCSSIVSFFKEDYQPMIYVTSRGIYNTTEICTEALFRNPILLVKMTQQKKPVKNKQIKAELSKELHFLKGLFSIMHLPSQTRNDEENADYEIVADDAKSKDDKDLPKRARSIAELEEKLEKLKSQNKFNLKNKLVKKSLSSKLNKKIKKKERINKSKIKSMNIKTNVEKTEMDIEKHKVNNVINAKPVFNNDGKLVFSKFDFPNIGQRGKEHKTEKDPKKILENLKQQKERLQQLEQKEDGEKVKEIKEKMAWKTILQKAEGQKVKDDPLLLKKSIKKMEQKKKQSKKQWDNRISGVEQKKDERQKKRKENIMKKKKEKKSKIVKAAVKRGRVVI